MCKPQCMLALLALSFNYAYSWDIALTVGDQLEFYSNGTKTSNHGTRFRDLTALAYDAVYNMLLFVDKQSDNASIFSFNLSTKKYHPLVKRKSYENIQGIAFDPITGLLFWTDLNEKSIYWKSLRPGVSSDAYGNILFKMDDEIPRAIAVDSCRGYIYWTNTNIRKPTIERARFDGSERKVIIDKNIYMPVSIAIDQRTKTLFWADDKEGIHYSIDSSDLEGNNRKNMVAGIHHQPNAMTVSKDAIYWVDFGFKSVWKMSKASNKSIEPTQLASFSSEMPFAVVAYYGIDDQTVGVSECEALSSLSKNKSVINDSVNIPSDAGLFCLHGMKIDGRSCKCSPGYIGERCEISVCQNYCFNGDCSLSSSGEPECRCKNGFIGTRCEVDICYGHCLNQGKCSVNDQKPVCKCSQEFEGLRCETFREIARDISNDVPKTMKSEAGNCNCTKENSSFSTSSAMTVNDGEFVETSTCVDGWDPIRDPIIMVLGTLSGLLCVACAVFITKILKLKRRPRIKKRIIVNKNVTPLTARPDQCEITIENCCNMNICETPCFEPRSTIRPTLLDAKPGKEEKKNLITNMEYPDDF